MGEGTGQAIGQGIGLALGGGTVRGAAHIGVLKVLAHEAGIPIRWVAGSSSGGMIAALFAAGVDWSKVELMALRLRWRDVFDLRFPPRSAGFAAGNRLMELLERLLGDRRIEELPIPLALTAVDLTRGKLEVFRSGPLLPAIRATIALPGLFVPVRHQGRVLVDGGVLNNVPADVVRGMGAPVVVAVDVTPPRPALPGGWGVIHRCFEVMRAELTSYALKAADIVLEPELDGVETLDVRAIPRTIRAGREAARRALPQIQAAIERSRMDGLERCERHDPVAVSFATI